MRGEGELHECSEDAVRHVRREAPLWDLKRLQGGALVLARVGQRLERQSAHRSCQPHLPFHPPAHMDVHTIEANNRETVACMLATSRARCVTVNAESRVK